ncbi:MAG: HAD-IB family phosphatase [Candidatus Promineifilaceae bacterium]
MRWPYYDHVFFDCDTTLSTIEGIDILAESAGKKEAIEALTKAAMEGQLGLEDVYAKRLAAITPTKAQIRHVRDAYKQNIVEDAAEVIAALKYLGYKVYIISGGLYEPVAEFGVYLGVPRENIRAVEIEYDQLSGRWWEPQNDSGNDVKYMTFDEGPLTISDGKAQIVRELLGDQKGRSLLIGDGSSDLRASRAVDLFVGFGGVETRKPVLDNAPVFLHSSSLTPLLALVCGPAGLAPLENTPFATHKQKSLNLIAQGALTFTDERISKKFNEAYQAVSTRTS